jgi:hypothetical protein
MEKLKKPPIGARVTHANFGAGTIVASDDCEVIKKHFDRSQDWRDEYFWVKFDDGYINGWSDTRHISYIPTPQEKVEAARKVLAEAEAELAASLAPKAGDRYRSAFSGITATVKFVDDNVVYYEFVSNGYTDYSGRNIESFLKTYDIKLCNC